MGVLEVVLSAVVCAVVVVSVARIAAKAGFSPWWALVPAAATAVAFATLATVHRHARFGALSLHTVVHSARALVIADAACLGVTVLLLVVFAVVDWPARRVAPTASVTRATTMTTPTSANARSKAHRRGRAAGRAKVAEAEVPARMRVRALPDVTGQPAGWFPSGALGSGEQSYWDGTKWTARRCWRNEMWVNQPVGPSLLAEPMR